MAVIDNLEIRAKADVSKAISQLDTLQKKIDGLKGTAKNASANIGAVGNAVSDAGKKASKASGGIEKLAASIKRVFVYRMIRTAIKAVSQAFVEGTKNAYMWAAANNDAFKSVMDAYATRTNYLKNSIGALASTVLTAMLPAFLAITDVLVKVINYVNEFIAAVSGADYFMKAREVEVFAYATDDAAKAQKRLNQQLMAFDELNVIKTPTAGGGAADNSAWDDAFYKEEVSDFMKNNWGWIAAGGLATIVATSLANGVLQGLTGTTAMGAVSTLGSALTAALQITAGITLAIVGVKMAFEGGVGMSTGEGTEALLLSIGGAIATALGGSLISTAAGIGGAPGIIIGLEFSVLATLAGVVVGPYKDQLKEILFGEFASVFKTGKGTATKEQPITSGGITTLNWLGDVFSGAYLTGNWSNGGGKTGGNTGGGANDGIDAITSAQPARLPAIVKPSGATVSFRANGGFPEMGSLFLAGEVPGSSEFVGNINGRTGVASGEEITGISEAVYATGNENASLLRELIDVCARGQSGIRASASFGRVVSESLRMYKGVTG